jgi:hypothetical protein
MSPRTINRRDAQTGVTLVTALIFLAVISMLSITSLRSSTVGVRMAQNEESRFTAIQAAQALTEAIVGSPASTLVIGGAGFSNCTTGEVGCNTYAIAVPAGFLADALAAGQISARVERLTPPEKPPPRVLESSLDKFSAASFQIIATFDRTDEGLGRAQLVEGLLVLVPKN